MRVDAYEFGRVTIDGVRHEHDVIVESGAIHKRRKVPSKPRRDKFGHTPLTSAEEVLWSAPRLSIGTGAFGRLPVAQDLLEEARRRGVEVLRLPTPDLVRLVNEGVPAGTNLRLHVTC